MDKEAIVHLIEQGLVEGANDRLGGTHGVVIPDNYSLFSFEEILPFPSRKRGEYTFTKAESFIAFVNAHKEAAAAQSLAPMVCVFPPRDDSASAYVCVGSVKCVLDSHGPEQPGWRQFTTELSLGFSPEWSAWKANNTKGFSQLAFAEFVEDHELDFATPAGVDMLEIAQTLRLTTDSQFTSGKRLKDGQVQLQYIEKTTASGGTDGDVLIPEKFTIHVPIYEFGESVEVGVRLRYRVENREVRFFYKLIRPHLPERRMFDGIVDAIALGTELMPLYC